MEGTLDPVDTRNDFIRSSNNFHRFSNRVLLGNVGFDNLDSILSVTYCHPLSFMHPHLCVAVDDVPSALLNLSDNRSCFIASERFVDEVCMFEIGRAHV